MLSVYVDVCVFAHVVYTCVCVCVLCVLVFLRICVSGELDPERMGSGIQYGDSSLRQLRQPRGSTSQIKQQCNC